MCGMVRTKPKFAPEANNIILFGPGVADYADCLEQVLTPSLKSKLDQLKSDYIEAGMPADLAQKTAQLPFMHSSLDIVDESLIQGSEVAPVAQIYFELLDHLHLKWLREQVERLPVEQPWHAHARGHLREQLFKHHRQLTIRVLKAHGAESGSIEAWFETHRAEVSRTCLMLNEMVDSNARDYPSLQVAIAGIEQLLKATEAH